jgi:hypothetical protein
MSIEHRALAWRGRAAPRPSEQQRGHAIVCTGLFATIRDVFFIVTRAHAAAELYDDAPRSDMELAARGLKRADLLRLAFNELTKWH